MPRCSQKRRGTSRGDEGDVGSASPDSGHAHRFAVVECGEVELEVGVLWRVGREVVHAERQHAYLEALPDVPDPAIGHEPEWEVLGQPFARHAQEARAGKPARATIRLVAIGTRMVSLSHPLEVHGPPTL